MGNIPRSWRRLSVGLLLLSIALTVLWLYRDRTFEAGVTLVLLADKAVWLLAS